MVHQIPLLYFFSIYPNSCTELFGLCLCLDDHAEGVGIDLSLLEWHVYDEYVYKGSLPVFCGMHLWYGWI